MTRHEYVDFDPDLAAIGAIEPRFVSDSVLMWRDTLHELADEIPQPGVCTLNLLESDAARALPLRRELR